VKFQPSEGFPIRDASVAWVAGDVTFLFVSTLAIGQLVRVDVEVAQENEDGTFRRAENFILDKMGEDVLFTLRETAEAINKY